MIEFSVQKKLHAAGGSMLFDVNYQVKKGAFVGVYGPSGSGKTSLLRMLSGFLKPASGYIKKDGNWWYDHQGKINLPPQNRSIGFVFQDYALFPNMTVKENLDYALKKGMSPNITDELLTLVELGQLAHQKIQTLSGGQKQRVALARALVRKPDLLLLDEPLSALDTALRERLQLLIYTLHKQFGLTTILVSHDLGEIARLADEIIFLKDGKIEKSGKTTDIFSASQNSNKKITATIIDRTAESLYVLIGKEIITIPVTLETDANLQKGDVVYIDFEKMKLSAAY